VFLKVDDSHPLFLFGSKPPRLPSPFLGDFRHHSRSTSHSFRRLWTFPTTASTARPFYRRHRFFSATSQACPSHSRSAQHIATPPPPAPFFNSHPPPRVFFLFCRNRPQHNQILHPHSLHRFARSHPRSVNRFGLATLIAAQSYRNLSAPRHLSPQLPKRPSRQIPLSPPSFYPPFQQRGCCRTSCTSVVLPARVAVVPVFP